MKRWRPFAVISCSTALLLFSFQNCSKVDFKAAPSEAPLEEKGTPEALRAASTFLDVPIAERRKVDMLMVVDNSVSMEEEQAAMASKFSGFISTLDNIDWRLAITTTQNESDAGPVSDCQLPGRDGCIFPFSSQHDWLDSSMSLSLTDQLFRNTIQMDADATYTDERGIHAAYRFLQRHQVGDHNFFREDSHVVVIVISDEDERSIGYHPDNDNPIELTDTPDFLIGAYTKGLKPASFKAHGIITRPGDADCWFHGNGRWPGDIYEELIVRTGGVVGDVCATDYGNQLSEISRTIQEQINSMTLECEPALGSVDIKMTESSPSIGGLGDEFVSVESQGLALDFNVNGTELMFSDALQPGDRVRVDYDCKP